jgi:pimeloyl-ACP methyl ester carboxylesterase
MLLVLASSHLAWTGTNSIRLVGYSLGGGIAAHFAATFPHMVSSLVLLAPAGLIRAERFGRITQFVFSSGIIPERILAGITSRRLQRPIASSNKVPRPEKTAALEIAEAEMADPPKGDSAAPLEQRVTMYVRWMVQHHMGFVPAFMSCIRHAPLTHQHDSWKMLAKRAPGTTAVLLASRDEIIDAQDYERDGLPLLGGKENVLWEVLPGGHDFVMTDVEPIMEQLDALWDMKV